MTKLSKETFIKQIERLIDAYPTWTIKSDSKSVMQTWYECFETLYEQQFIDAVTTHIKTETFNPTIARLTSKVTPVHADRLDIKVVYYR